jgi:REP element-mobilizing transposase RayT
VPSLRHEVFFHVMFSTKGRQQTISHEIKDRLWAHMESVCNDDKISVHAVGGAQNHVHLLIEPPPEFSIEEIVLKIQATSLQWMKNRVDDFAWQEGYGACTVSKSDLQKVVKVIKNQDRYHATMTYEEEFLAFLKENGIPYDPQDVFG